jgi:hypothetical protein
MFASMLTSKNIKHKKCKMYISLVVYFTLHTTNLYIFFAILWREYQIRTIRKGLLQRQLLAPYLYLVI